MAGAKRAERRALRRNTRTRNALITQMAQARDMIESRRVKMALYRLERLLMDSRSASEHAVEADDEMRQRIGELVRLQELYGEQFADAYIERMQRLIELRNA